MSLEGRVAIVTGSGRGIGRAVALRLAREGAAVGVGDLDGRAASAVAGEIEAQGGRALALPSDVTSKPSVQEMVRRVVAQLGRVDVLMNNAGGSSHYPRTPDEPAIVRSANGSPDIEEMNEEYFDYVLTLNVRTTFLCCQAVAPYMKRQRFGRIINMSSVSAKTGYLPSGVAYPCAKAAIIGLTKHLARELAPSGITVNALAPGITRSERVERLFLSDQEALAQTLREIPLGRIATVEDQAGVVAFLASDDAAYITGAVMDVNGGWYV